MGPPPILPIKSNIDMKSEKDNYLIKLRRNTRLKKPDMYELIMALFDNGYPEEFMLMTYVRTYTQNPQLQCRPYDGDNTCKYVLLSIRKTLRRKDVP